MDSLFNMSVEDATRTSVSEDKLLMVLVTKRSDVYDHTVERLFDDETIDIIKSNYVPVKLIEHTLDFKYFVQLFGMKSIPSIYMVKDGKLLGLITSFDDLSNEGFMSAVKGISPFKERKYDYNDDSIDAEDTAEDVAEDNDDDSKTIPTNFYKPESVPKCNEPKCTLSFRLLDGSTIQKQFDGSNTLNEVRLWLDTQSGIDIVPSSSLPSFARPDGLHPTRYAFQSPTVPRVTFDDQHEFVSLYQLKLCPRSVLILKPLFDESVNEAYEHNKSIIRTFGSSVKRFCNAVYSFFDYGVDDVSPEDDDDNKNMIAIDKCDNNVKLDDNDQSSAAPKVLAFDDKKAALINFQDKRDTINDTNEDNSFKSKGINGNGIETPIKELEESRCSTPVQSIGTQPSMTRVATINDNDKQEDTRVIRDDGC